MIELPVFSIVADSLTLPFRYLPEVWRDTVCAEPGLRCNQLSAEAREDASSDATGVLMVAHFVLFTPFSVTWSKLAIYGRPAIATDPPFAYARSQWARQHLLATTVMNVISLAIIAGPPAALLRYGQQNLDNQVITMAGVLLCGGLILFAIGFVRLAFVFPAIAIGKYPGISAAWTQTRGNIERLAAIVILSVAPFHLLRHILHSGI